MAIGATPLYYNLAKLARVKLPNLTSYALIDYNGRELIAEIFSTNSSYEKGDYVLYSSDGYGSELFEFIVDHSAGAWNANHVTKTNVAKELKDLNKAIIGGIHYRGKTVTPIYDGANTNPVSIGGESYTAVAGDMVIFDKTNSSSVLTYAIETAYSAHTYIKNDGIVYITNDAITAGENTDFNAIREKLDAVKGDPEYLFDGNIWNLLGSGTDGLGDLAFKDTASGSYVKPSGTGSVTVNDYSIKSADKKKLTTTDIYAVASTTVNVSKMSQGDAKDVAKVGSATKYGTANVGASVRYGTANVGSARRYGTANVDTAVEVATGISGTTEFCTEGVKSVSLTGTTEFCTNAIKGVSLTGAQTFVTEGIVTSVTDDCLTFALAQQGTVGVDTTPADKSSVGINAPAAGKKSFSLQTKNITPAVEAATTQTMTPAVEAATTQTLTPAIEAPATQTLTPAESNGTIVQWSKTSDYDVATSPVKKTLATGALEAGSDIVVSISASASTKTVDVDVETDTVTVS